jgi:membrane-bound metal-dependent hydrolase YbcI (DUF457 family)
MLLFAHLGLTLASGRLMRWVDLAFLALGSMLPDIIDNPLGLVVFGTPAEGRTFCHTLLFLLVLAALAFYLKDVRLASVSAGVAAHLVLDFIWQSPIILFWPLLGGFPRARELGYSNTCRLSSTAWKTLWCSCQRYRGCCIFFTSPTSPGPS